MLKQLINSLLIILLAGTATTSLSQTKTLNVLGMKNYPPFSFEDKGKMVGIDNDVMFEIGKRIGLDIKIEYRPWKRLLADLQYGDTDAAFALFFTEERSNFALYAKAEPIHGGLFYLYVKKGAEFNFDSVSDLKGKKLGLQLAFSVSDEFDNAVNSKELNILNAFSNVNNIELLLADRVEAFIGHELVTGYNLRKMEVVNQVTKLPLPISEKKAYLALSRESKTFKDKKSLLNKINQALVDMKEDGTHQKIVSKYVN